VDARQQRISFPTNHDARSRGLNVGIARYWGDVGASEVRNGSANSRPVSRRRRLGLYVATSCRRSSIAIRANSISQGRFRVSPSGRELPCKGSTTRCEAKHRSLHLLWPVDSQPRESLARSDRFAVVIRVRVSQLPSPMSWEDAFDVTLSKDPHSVRVSRLRVRQFVPGNT